MKKTMPTVDNLPRWSSLEAQRVVGKKAVITVKLVDESTSKSNKAIADELFRWFLEALPAPWVKEVDCVFVQDP